MANGCFTRIAGCYVRRPCLCFWSYLLLYIFLSFLGVTVYLLFRGPGRFALRPSGY